MFYAFVGSGSRNYVLTAERSVKPEEVRLLETQSCKKINNQQEGLQQVQQLSPSVLVEKVSHAVCNVKENKVFAEKLWIEHSNYFNL